MQYSDRVLMIEPVNFGFNAETAVNNSFQRDPRKDIQQQALQEFNGLVNTLRANKVSVTVIKDCPDPFTPDSIFPNNWISLHEDGTVFLYPMYAPNRRLERKPQVLEALRKKFKFGNTVDLSSHEKEHRFLEGTGSMVLDRENKIAYACISPRTDKSLFESFCKSAGYRPISFTASDQHHREIYHTNVMMCVADKYAVICLASIVNISERKIVRSALEQSGKVIIEISLDQMNHFAGNMLQVNNAGGQKYLVMSTQAYQSLTPEQAASLEKFNPILHASLTTIETNGGGSARCMMAEVYLPQLT